MRSKKTWYESLQKLSEELASADAPIRVAFLEPVNEPVSDNYIPCDFENGLVSSMF